MELEIEDKLALRNLDLFDELEKWYIQNLQNFKVPAEIFLQTLSNAAWSLEVHLTNTKFESQPFEMIDISTNENNWIDAFIDNKKFESTGDLGDVLACFIYSFVHKMDIKDRLLTNPFISKDSPWSYLENWYLSHCDEVWEFFWAVRIYTQVTPGWFVEIKIEDTELDDKEYVVNQALAEKGIHCRVEEKSFIGEGSPLHLTNIIEEFIRWKNAE